MDNRAKKPWQKRYFPATESAGMSSEGLAKALAGNFFALLKSVEAVGGDVKFSAPSASAFASPSLLIPVLSVAGK